MLLVYAGTVLEEGELTIRVRAVGGCSRYDKVVKMIEESEKLKSGLRAAQIAREIADVTIAADDLNEVASILEKRTKSVKY